MMRAGKLLRIAKIVRAVAVVCTLPLMLPAGLVICTLGGVFAFFIGDWDYYRDGFRFFVLDYLRGVRVAVREGISG